MEKFKPSSKRENTSRQETVEEAKKEVLHMKDVPLGVAEALARDLIDWDRDENVRSLMEEETKSRILRFPEFKGMNRNELERAYGVFDSLVYHVMARTRENDLNTSIDQDELADYHDLLQDISPEASYDKKKVRYEIGQAIKALKRMISAKKSEVPK